MSSGPRNPLKVTRYRQSANFSEVCCEDSNFYLAQELWFEPTDLSRAFRPFQSSPKWRSALAYASPNLNELRVMHNIVFGKDYQLSAGASFQSPMRFS
ncbi:hypothetical protein TNCV_2742791 [Trichonephila clavipes]|nr:hypothetical protein TNCV_2742791 [Trichonephila clavipes]